MNRFDRKSFKQASRRKANDLLNKIKNLFGKEVTLDKIRFDNEYCIDFDGTVDGKSAYISIAIEKWPGYTEVTVVIDNDVFSTSVRGGASEAAKYLSENFTILSGEDKLFKEAKDHDEALRTSSRAIAGKHSGDSDVSVYMKKLKSCLKSYWDGVQYLEDYYDGANMHEVIFLDDENGGTHFVELEFEYADIEDGDPCFLVCPFEECMWAFEVDATLDPLRDARSITEALNDEIRSLS